MSMFIVAISYLPTSNLPWFVDLTFQVPMQYCSLQHRTLPLSPATFTTGCCFCFGSVSSFFLELFLYWSPVAYCAPTDLGSSSFSILSFCLLILFMGFSRQGYWSGLPFPSPVDHFFSELSTMTHLSWVALHGMTHSFIELDKESCWGFSFPLDVGYLLIDTPVPINFFQINNTIRKISFWILLVSILLVLEHLIEIRKE